MKNITAALFGGLRGALVASLLVLNFSLPPAHAQFQNAVVTGAGGSANAQTGTVSFATTYSDLLDVPLIFVPAANNSGDATLAISGLGGPLSGSAPHFRKGNGAGVGALVSGELVIGQPELIYYDGTYFQIIGPVTLPINAGNLTSSTIGFNVPANLQINASVASNQLTISLVTNNGAAATAASPISIAFRDTTIANGDPVIVQITGALSFTIGSGNSLGCLNAVTCRLRLYTINNAGTIALCAYNSNSAGTSIVGLNEANLQTSASGTSGGNSAQTLYCSTSGVASKAVREIGYVDIQEITAGTWASGPTYVQLMGPGIVKAGAVIQELTAVITSVTNTTPGAKPGASTNSTITITPTSAANLIEVDSDGSVFNGATTVGSAGYAQLARNSSSTLIGNICITQSAVSTVNAASCHLYALDAPSATSATTYTVYIWEAGASALNVGWLYSSVGNTRGTIKAKEIAP